MDGEKEKLKSQKYTELYMDLAERIAKMSHARRLQVGSILVKNNNIISFGWNGMPSGWDNNCEDIEYIAKEDCQYTDKYLVYNGFTETAHGWSRLYSKPEVLHSEVNCLAKIARSTNSSDGASLFVTHAPCLDCAKIIYQAGIKEVYYKHSYRETSGLDFLKKCKIDVVQVQ
jgi:dCMP deaminase